MSTNGRQGAELHIVAREPAASACTTPAPEVFFASLAQAAPMFGYSSAAALYKAFQRGQLPRECLVNVGRACRVDVERLRTALRALAPEPRPS